MQYIFKKNSLYLNYMFNFQNTSKLLIKSIFFSLIFSSCSIVTEEKKIFSNRFETIKNNNQLIQNITKNNQKIQTQFFKNYKTIQNKSNITQDFTDNIFVKKTIHIKEKSNFFKSSLESGLTLSDINNITKAIEWQINFKKLNVNSTFHLIFLKKKLSCKKSKNILLGIKLNHLGKTYYAVRANNGYFYDINGHNKSKMIMDFSLFKKYRISSYFNLHRLHPITHHISRHLGVDLAMPQGTLVLSTSSGKIIKAAFNKISGFYIVLKNQNHYITKYMHLKKILVKVGQNIKINQKIALSGNTGRTTGPHLHYEIWINKHPIDPIYAQSKFIKPLTKTELILYFKTFKILLSKFK